MRARLRAVLAFTAVVFRSLARDRSALFFMLLMPAAVIVIIGATFGGQGSIRVGLITPSDGAVAGLIESGLQAADGIEVARYTDEDALARDIRRYVVDAGVVVPGDLDAAIARGDVGTVGFVSGAVSDTVLTVRLAVGAVVDDVAVQVGAASFAVERADVSFDEALRAAGAASATGGVTIVTSDVGSGQARTQSDFALVAPQNLVLFTFINALATAAFLVHIRKAGVLRRAMATRTGLGSLLLGLGVGWFTLALVQASMILAIGRLAFDVRWGDPIAVGLLVVLWALVGCGAGLLVGALGENEDRVGAVMPIVGIVLGALGGCMVPLELFPDRMRTVALAVPHAWALSGLRKTVFDGAGVADVSGSLAVLAAWAVGLLLVATVLLRRRLVKG